MFVNCPRKFIVQLPCHHGHEYRPYSKDTRDGDEIRSDRGPDMKVDVVVYTEIDDGSLDLVHLHCSIDK